MWGPLFYVASAMAFFATKGHARQHIAVHTFKHLLESFFGGGRHR